jgi:hypothetical protein
MTPASRNFVVGLTLAITSAAALEARWAGPQQRTAPPSATVKTPKGGASEPWPDAKTIESRRAGAEGRKLFASDDPLPFTLTADFKAIDDDKNPDSTKVYQATIEFAGPDGQPKIVPVELRPRGHSRRIICSFVPVRITFPKALVKGTIFDGMTSVKLGVHCKGELADIIVREYAAYKIDNLLTPLSFRVRSATGTYVDVKTKKTIDTRFGMFIEDDDDVARRASGRLTDEQQLRFANVDMDTVTTMLLFEYMIANTDVSLAAQHNIRVVELPTGQKYPVPYDFDYGGLINAPYAVPAAQLHIDTVRDRVYRGPCRPAADLAPILAKFESIKAAVMAIYDTLPIVKSAYRTEAKKYLADFYKTIESPGSVKHEFTECKTLGM